MLRHLVSTLKSNFFQFVLFVCIITGVGSFYSGRLCSTQNPTFSVKKVVFDGNEKISDITLLKASGLRYKSNIFNVPINEVKKKLEDIAWVKSIVVQRRLPDTIYVRVSERMPIAILQSKYKLYLVDADGVVLEHDNIGDCSNLPIVVGEGAAQAVAVFLCQLNKFPKIRNQLIFAVRVGNRRWNIRINKGITVKLPERELRYALTVLDEISDSNGFFNDDIEVIDLRMHDRIVLTKKDGKHGD